MNVSTRILQKCLDFELPSVDELVEKIGAQLGAVEAVVDLSKRYKGIVTAKVVTAEPIAGTDHLHVCTIDDGSKVRDVARNEQGHVQVVCGAPNVKAGLHVVWLPPGTTLPESIEKEPLTLEVREIRGVKSYGMLASLKELAISDNHEGIVELPTSTMVGKDFAEVFELNDHIINIENKMFTHRPDCFGQLGIAREVAGIFGQHFRSPDWYVMEPEAPHQSTEAAQLQVTVAVPELCPRYMAAVLEGVRVEPSPLWLQITLSKLGIRPINNIVDITNYVMLETAQPLHAFDFAKVAKDGSATIVVRKPRTDEQLTLLDGKTITPRKEAIVICDDTKPIALGGVMGGNNSEIGIDTTKIIIECANFNMYAIRRTAMEHGLFTDAVTRFTKGQSPWQCAAVLQRTIALIQELCPSASLRTPIVDVNNAKTENQAVNVTPDFINARLGLKLTGEQIAKLLQNVTFDVQTQEDTLAVTAPFWRTDISIAEDIVEEVGRLHGFDAVPLTLPMRSSIPAPQNALLKLKAEVRSVLAASGANEILTYSFVHGNLLAKVGQATDDAFQIANALSPDLQYYRLSLTPSVLEKVHPNIKAGYDSFALFEIGRGHNLKHQNDDDGLPTEFEMLDLVVAANDKAKPTGAAFYSARYYLTTLAVHFGLELAFRPLSAAEDYPVAKPYDHTRSAQVFVKDTNIALGMVGEYTASVRRALKLPSACAGFGIGLVQLQQAIEHVPLRYTPLPRFPKVEQDITLSVSAETTYQAVYDFLETEVAKIKPDHTVANWRSLDIYQKTDNSSNKHFTFRLTIASYERTLTDSEIAELLEKVGAAAKETLHADRI